MKNIIYSIRRDTSSHQYNHIHVDIYSRANLDHYASKPILSLEWQGDNQCDRWYAFKASSQVENTGENSVKRFKLASTILASISGIDYDDIGAVIAKLDCDRMVEDRRIGEWLKIEDVKPETWHRYMSIRDGSCECSAIAPDEESAVKALIKAYAKNMESGYGNYADKLSSWIKDGSPVKVDHYAKSPDVSDLAELIKPMKEKVIEVTESVAA